MMHSIVVGEIPSANHYVAHSRGRHFKSAKAKNFEKAVAAQLACDFGRDFPLAYSGLRIVFVLRKGFGRRDLDNMPKAFIDCLARYFGFNDSKIEKLALEKRLDRKSNCETILWEAL